MPRKQRPFKSGEERDRFIAEWGVEIRVVIAMGEMSEVVILTPQDPTFQMAALIAENLKLCKETLKFSIITPAGSVDEGEDTPDMFEAIHVYEWVRK